MLKYHVLEMIVTDAQWKQSIEDLLLELSEMPENFNGVFTKSYDEMSNDEATEAVAAIEKYIKDNMYSEQEIFNSFFIMTSDRDGIRSYYVLTDLPHTENQMWDFVTENAPEIDETCDYIETDNSVAAYYGVETAYIFHKKI